MVNFYLDWVLDFVKALQTLYMNSEAIDGNLFQSKEILCYFLSH